jgi:hypothetical protein
VIEAFANATASIEGDDFGSRSSVFLVKWIIEQKVNATNDAGMINIWNAAAAAH